MEKNQYKNGRQNEKFDSKRRFGEDIKKKGNAPAKRPPLEFSNDNDESEEASGIVVGRNAVRELLKSGRSIDKIFVQKGEREGSITVLVAESIQRKIPVLECEKSKLDTLAETSAHQGIVALAAAKEYVGVDDILNIAKERGEMPLVVIADGIVDPHNLGALIRCAEGAGAHGLIIPKRRSAGITQTVSKSSAGAVEHLAIAKVPNLASVIDDLKEKGLWIYGAEAGGTSVYDTDFTSPAAIVLGSEGDGISKLISEKCDFIVSIPMYGRVNSFNVSAAAAVILSDVKRKQMTYRKQ